MNISDGIQTEDLAPDERMNKPSICSLTHIVSSVIVLYWL